MESKVKVKNIFSPIVLFIGIVSLFSGCGSVGQAYQKCQNSDARYYINSAAQGLQEGQSGRKYVGTADSESECAKKAQEAGCTGQYAYYANTKSCFCD
jgi:uncharacterized protein YceK